MKGASCTTKMPTPEISVVVRSFNEQRHLPALFDGLDRQSARGFEVIVVDSGSVDRSREIATERGARLVRIRDRDFTFGYSLNQGIKHARGEYVAIVSSHTEAVDGSWLANLVDPLRDDRTAMTYGRQLGGPSSKFGETRDFLRTFGPNRLDLQPPAFFANNANSALRRSLWESHPFDETLPGLEDIAWAKHWMERGYRVAYEPRAAVFHYHEETWPQVRRRYYREAMAAKWIGLRGRRHIPREVLRETLWLGSDVGAALRGQGAGRLGEIIRFRVQKTRGTVRGLWDAGWKANPRRHPELYFDRSYRAVVVSSAGTADLVDREIPEVLPTDVLVKVAFTGICSTDLEVYEGSLGYYRTGRARYPIVPGHEVSGRVAKVGAKVDRVVPGEAVVVACIQGCGECASCHGADLVGCNARREVGVMNHDGGYAEYVVVPAEHVHKIPTGTSLRLASLAEPLAVVMKGLRRLEATHRPTAGMSAAVIGAGAIGHLAARVLALRGVTVTVVDSDPRRRAHLEGVPGIRTSADISDAAEARVIVEATGSRPALQEALQTSRPGATLLLLGFPYGTKEFNFESIVSSDKAVIGSVGSGPDDFAAALALLPRLDLHAFESEAFALERFRDAWEAQRARTALKVTLAVDPGLEHEPSEASSSSTAPLAASPRPRSHG